MNKTGLLERMLAGSSNSQLEFLGLLLLGQLFLSFLHQRLLLGLHIIQCHQTWSEHRTHETGHTRVTWGDQSTIPKCIAIFAFTVRCRCVSTFLWSVELTSTRKNEAKKESEPSRWVCTRHLHHESYVLKPLVVQLLISGFATCYTILHIFVFFLSVPS